MKYTVKVCPEFAKLLYSRGKEEFKDIDLDKKTEAFDDCGYFHLT